MTAQEREVQRHDLITDELLDAAVVLDDGGRRDRVEAVEQTAELGGRHPLGHARRAADVGEEKARLDLCTPTVRGHEIEAGGAHRRVLVRWTFADHPHDRRADAREWCCAQHAARVGREPLEDATHPALRRIATGEEVAPELLGGEIGIARPLRHRASVDRGARRSATIRAWTTTLPH
jgi:hypothetical protein